MTDRIKKLTAALLAGTMLLSLAACGGQEEGSSAPGSQEPEGVSTGQAVADYRAADQVFSVNYDPEAGINPITAASFINMQFWSLLYDSVFIVDEDFSVRSEVVTDYASEDGIWWVFNIDTSIPFHDGSTLTAQDIVYSIRRAMQTEYYRSRLSCIYGISAMSDDSFAITAGYANFQLPALLNIPIVKDGTGGDEVPVGSGPYCLAESGDRLTLFSQHRHADEMPLDVIYLKSFTDTAEQITAFEDSRIDIVTNDPTGMFNLGYGSGNETRYYDTTNLHYLGFNMTGAFFQSALMRYAVGYAVDRDGLVEDYMNGCGVVTTLPVHPKSQLYDADYASGFGYDPEIAARLFESAGVRDYDNDGALEVMVTGIVVELSIKFIVNNNSTVKLQAARMICESLNELGITTVLYELNWDDYIEALEKGEYDMYYGEIRMTPDWNLSYLFEEYEDSDSKGMNYANCFDSRYTELYAAYLAAGEADRYAAFQELCRYICGNGAIIPICFEKRQVLTHRGVAGGIAATQYDIFNKFYEWTINLE